MCINILVYICVYLLFALPLFITDLTKLVLPNKMVFCFLVSGLTLNYYRFKSFYNFLNVNISGVIFGYFILYFLYWMYYFVAKKEGVGRGDIKLFAAIGGWFGAYSLPILLLYSSILGLLYYILLNYVFRYIFHIKKIKYIPLGSCMLLVGLIFIL